ncbi:DUF1015 family protein [Flammeovirgaceae bacterium SG7u.111]|nr:DUF1015 family protein [Flammeovirgaceae bacterium SG7u.132]WPO38503.1 DUF1015 family protein [Flammeovirgaceae bacterium SG7u.111]
MARIKAFKGLRPIKEKVTEVASRPYDVLNTEEAKTEAKGKELSFLHVVKPEMDFPVGSNPYAPEVYEKGKSNFQKMVDDGVFFQDEKDSIYIYELTMNGRSQTGIVACASIDDYFNDIVKKHELTRPDKEEDRKNHVRVGKMNAEPVFFAYPAYKPLDVLMDEVKTTEPVYDFVAEDKIRHVLWKVDDEFTVNNFIEEFAKVPATYVADGHHRTAAAALVGKEFREANLNHTGEEEYNYFLAVHFPDDQLEIIDYNRVVKDLNGLSKKQFLEKLDERFIICKADELFKPNKLHMFSLYIDGEWYALEAKEGTYDDKDPIGVLDVTVLSKQILEPILGIKDLRTDKRIEFVGGIRGLDELKKRVDSGEMAAAFALYPVTMQQLINIADSGAIMPPKTTWFEPKLRSGLVVHALD